MPLPEDVPEEFATKSFAPMRIVILLILTLLLLLTCPAYSDIGIEFSTGETFTDNLLLDSSDISDSYSTSSASIHFYPLAHTEINLIGEYNYYGEIIGLGNVMSGAEVSIIPLNEDSPFKLYLDGKFTNRSYRKAFRGYNTNDVAMTASLGYKFAETMQARAGFNLKTTNYINADDVDKDIYEAFTGIYVTLPGSNAFDLEVGYSTASIESIDTSTIYTFPQRLEMADSKLKKYYISPRFSRPLGRKNGISITYNYSEFIDFNDPLVRSYSTGFLSPWASVWDGSSLLISLKSYLIPKVKLTAGYGSWNKNYLNTLEGLDFIQQREDDVNRYFISASWPMPTASGLFIEPSVRVDYTDSVSSQKLYTFKGFSTVISLSMRL